MLGFWTPSGWELMVILVIGLLLFGRRLPEVGRNVGKAIVEFKKGIKGVEDDVGRASGDKDRLPAEASKPAIQASTSDSRRVSTADRVEEHG